MIKENVMFLLYTFCSNKQQQQQQMEKNMTIQTSLAKRYRKMNSLGIVSEESRTRKKNI